MNNRVPNIIMYAVLLAFTVRALYPLFYTLQTSLKTGHEYVDNKLSWPKQLTLDNYTTVLIKGRLLQYFLNNCLIMPAAMLVYRGVCISAGFAFGRLRFPFRLPIFLMIFPQRLLSIQIFQVCRKLRLVNSYLGIILVWVAYFAPFGTYIMTTFYASVPMELLESARLDGAGTRQLLFRIMVPIARPMIGILVIIGFQSMWNELPFSMLLLQKDRLRGQ